MKRVFLRAGILAALLLVLPLPALASGVDESIVDTTAPTGAVTLSPGASGPITINLTVTGNQAGTATFDVYRNWTLSGGTFAGSNPQTFTVPPRAAQDPATTFSTSGTIAVAAGQAPRPTAFALIVGAFNIKNSNETGAKLGAGSSSNYSVTVQAPLDTTAPVIAFTQSPNGSDGWFTSPTGTVHVVATDLDDSGVSSLTCTLDGLAVGLIAAGSTSTTRFGDVQASTDGNHVVSCDAADLAGNHPSSPATTHLKVDHTAPTLTPSVSPAADHGWYNLATGAPTLTFSPCSDATSGLASACPSPKTFGEGVSQSFGTSVFDNAGNETMSSVGGVNVDLTRPLVTITLHPTGDAGWFKTTPASVAVSASDANGIASLACTVDGDPVTIVSGGFDVVGDGTHSIACSAVDVPGNSGANSATLKLDATGPTITATLAPASPAASGWYNIETGAPTVSFACSDATSGLAGACPTPYTFADGASQSHSGSATDTAGNTTSAGVSGISVDTVAPTIVGAVSPDAAATGWYNIATGAPTVSFTCGDATSTIASCTDPQTLGEGIGQTVDGFAADKAGNSSQTSVGGIDVDLTAPDLTVALDRSPDGSNGWFISGPVNVTVLATDNFGTPDVVCTLDGADVAVVAGLIAVYGDGTHSVSCAATDAAGNGATGSVDIKLDTTAPSIGAALTPAVPASGWFNLASGAPVVSFTCGDDTSGLAGACPAAHTFGEGTAQSFSQTIYDVAGNSASAGVDGVKVDLGKPTTSVAGVSDGATYTLGSVPSAACLSDDAISGIKTAATVAKITGGTVNGVGTFTATCSAPTDNAGNVGDAASVTYRVAYRFVGFFQPIANPTAVNYGKAGRTYPVKWQIVDGSGRQVTALSAVKSVAYIKLQSAAFPPDIDGFTMVDTASTGGTSLRYDATGNQFVYNWATPSGTWSYIMVLTLDDGNVYCAYFSLAK